MYKFFFKRIIDVIVSLFGLIVTSPILILVAIAVKLESNGPVFFKQERLGKKGITFKIYKFRSMYVGAEKRGTGVYSGKNDTRVTKIGKIIRATSIDELPQFINILKGDMSLIGPRPALTYHPWRFEEYTHEQRHMFDVRPGVTGWAQINGRKDVEWNKRIELNIWYVNNLSFLLDFRIFLKTIFKVIMMKDNVNKSETKKGDELNGTKTNVYHK